MISSGSRMSCVTSALPSIFSSSRPDGQISRLGLPLRHGGQMDVGQAPQGDVVKPDDGKVLRRVESALLRRLQHLHGKNIRVGDDGVGTGRGAKQPPGLLKAPGVQVLRPVRRRGGAGDQMVCQHGSPVALQPLLQSPGILPAAQKYDPPVSQPVEILDAW